MTFIPQSDFLIEVAKGNVTGHQLVNKYGRNGVVGTTAEPIISETLAGAFWTPIAASTVRIKAGGSVNDINTTGSGARTIEVQGIDENFARVTETIACNGASASSSTTTTYFRVDRAFVVTAGTYGGSNAAEIIIENTAGTADIITIDFHTSTHQGQSLHCAWAAPTGTEVYLTGLVYNCDTTKTNDVHLKVTDDISVVSAPYGATRTIMEFEGVNRQVIFTPNGPVKLSKPGITTPMDIWVEGLVSATTSIVSARMQLLVVTV